MRLSASVVGFIQCQATRKARADRPNQNRLAGVEGVRERQEQDGKDHEGTGCFSSSPFIASKAPVTHPPYTAPRKSWVALSCQQQVRNEGQRRRRMCADRSESYAQQAGPYNYLHQAEVEKRKVSNTRPRGMALVVRATLSIRHSESEYSAPIFAKFFAVAATSGKNDLYCSLNWARSPIVVSTSTGFIVKKKAPKRIPDI